MTSRKEKNVIEPAQPPEVGVVGAAAELFATLPRLGLQLALLPALPLPQGVRRVWFSFARGVTEASAVFPQAMLKALDQFADEIDDLETRTSHREDLGRRLRRERRRSHRQTHARTFKSA